MRPTATIRSLPVGSGVSHRVTHAQLLGHDQPASLGGARQHVKVTGLIRSIRKQKRVAFAHVQDGTTYEPIQAILSPELATDLTNGAYVELTGAWQESPGKGQSFELQVATVDNVGSSNADENPIQKQSMPVDFLRTVPHMRIRTPLQSILARARSHLIRSAGDFYENELAEPATQIQPPLITTSDCEGAGEVFTLAPQSYSTPPGSKATEQEKDKPKLFFREPKYLTVSSQLHLEAWAAELGSVWTLSPTFRAEESDTTRHLAEFYMLEAEFRGLNSLPALTSHAENLIRSLSQSLSSHRIGAELLAYYSDRKHRPADQTAPGLEERWAKLAPSSPYPIVKYVDALKELEAAFASNTFEQRPSWRGGFNLEHERWIVEHIGKGFPTIVTHYPKTQKPFYMLPSIVASDSEALERTDDTVACFDILLPYGYAEVCGGSLREHRLPNLIQAMRKRGLLRKAASGEDSPYPHLEPGESLGNLEWYADLRRFGTSPHGGFGMGFDRLLAYLTGPASVRDVVGFPRYWGRAEC